MSKLHFENEKRGNLIRLFPSNKYNASIIDYFSEETKQMNLLQLNYNNAFIENYQENLIEEKNEDNKPKVKHTNRKKHMIPII